MSKFTDLLLAEALFKQPKEKKVKSDLSFRDFVRMQKELEDYQEWRKLKEKKEDKKPEGPWQKLSVWQKLTVLMITVPLALMAEVMVLLKFGLVIGKMFHP